MRQTLSALFNQLVRNEDGVTLVEYGIAIGLAISVGVVLFNQLAVDINNNVGSASAVLT